MSIDYYQDSKQLFTDPFPKIRNNLKMCRKKREKHVKQRQETLAAKAAKRKKI